MPILLFVGYPFRIQCERDDVTIHMMKPRVVDKRIFFFLVFARDFIYLYIFSFINICIFFFQIYIYIFIKLWRNSLDFFLIFKIQLFLEILEIC